MVKFNINSRGNKVLYKERSVRMHLGFFQKKSVTSLKQLLKKYLKLFVCFSKPHGAPVTFAITRKNTVPHQKCLLLAITQFFNIQ